MSRLLQNKIIGFLLDFINKFRTGLDTALLF